MFERLKPLTPLIVLAALVAPVLGIAACGGGGGSSADAQTVINQTFTGNKKVDSGKLELAITAKLRGSGVAAQQLKEPITVKIGGPFESRGDNELPNLDLQLSATGGGAGFSAGAISTGDKGFISYQGKDYVVPDKVFQQFRKGFQQQQKKDQSSSQLDLKALGIDPQKWLKDPKNEGEKDVAGAKTIHVSAGVNVSALLDDVNDLLKRTDKLGLSQQQQQQLPTNITASQKKQIEEAVKKAKLDVYTGKADKTLRRLELEVSFQVPDSLKGQAQGLEGGDVSLTLQIADINKAQNITAPKGALPWSKLQQQINSLTALSGGTLGGGSGTTGSSGSGSSTGSGTGSSSTGSGLSKRDKARTQAYLKCVQKAKTPQDSTACGAILSK